MEGNFTLEEVVLAYFVCRRHKRKTYNALTFEVNWMSNCVELYNEITNRTYTIGKSIAFAVTRPKLREVFAADFRDRVVHHLIMKELEYLFEGYFIEDTYNCRKEKGTTYGFNRLHEKIKECSEDYTKDCYVFKGDMKGFFMSIHKPTLWAMLEKFIKAKYRRNNLDLLLWLTKMIVLHSPEKNCIIKGDKKLLEQLPKDKSLFTCGDDFGLPIGNLTSLMFANFYLSEFDKWMTSEFEYYGRYVDDFFIVCKNKKKILKTLPIIREKLSKYHITLHPDKIYLLHYTKGIKFIGAVSKLKRKYMGSRTVGNMMYTLKKLNSIKDKENHVDEFLSRMNSYLGFMRLYNTYDIKRKLYKLFDKEWWNYVIVKSDKGKHKLCLKKLIKIQRKKELIKNFRI